MSDYFIDFFFLNTFSPFAHTTLNSILQEKVAVKDLKHVIDNKLSTISSQNIHLDTSSSNIELRHVPHLHNLCHLDTDKVATPAPSRGRTQRICLTRYIQLKKSNLNKISVLNYKKNLTV